VQREVRAGIGSSKAVQGAPAADKLVVSAAAGGKPRLFLVDRSAVKLSPRRSLDSFLEADIVFSRAKAEALDSGLAEIEEATDFASALICAEAVGALKFSCDTTLEYLKTRKQFGVPIGTFQALQHRIVEMFISTEQARSMACLACSKIDSSENSKDRARAISAAKIKIATPRREPGRRCSSRRHGHERGLKDQPFVPRLTGSRHFGRRRPPLARFASVEKPPRTPRQPVSGWVRQVISGSTKRRCRGPRTARSGENLWLWLDPYMRQPRQKANPTPPSGNPAR
jgi:hypothetical protein